MDEKRPLHMIKGFLKENVESFLLLTLLVFICYTNSLWNDFVSDDIAAIPGNPTIKTIGYLFTNPLFFARSIPFYIIFKIGGAAPFFFRLLNVFFHLGNVLLLYVIIRRLSGKTIAILVSALFSVHPVLSESVSWISGGVYSQYAFFFLLSFLLFILSVKIQVTSYTLRVTGFLYALSLFSFLLALSTSEKAVVLPFVLLLYEFCFGSLKDRWIKIIPYFLVSFFWGILYLMLRLTERVNFLQSQFHLQEGFDNPIYQIPIAIVSYLRLIFLPVYLTFYHSELNFTYGRYVAYLLLFLGFLTVAVVAFKKNKAVFFWISFFVITLLPTLTPFRISWIVAERYVYLGTAGILFAVGYLLGKIAEKDSHKVKVYGVFVFILLLLMIRTIYRNIDWKNQDNLWIATAKTSPSSPVSHNNLAGVYVGRKDYKSAEKELKIAIQLNPNYADAYHNLGNIYKDTGRQNVAIGEYKKAVSLNPGLWQSYLNLSSLYFDEKKYMEAKEQIQKAIAIVPENYALHRNLGIIYYNLKEKDKAMEEFLKVLQIEPRDKLAQMWVSQ